MGVAPGNHALNPPQSETFLAWGSRSSNLTLTVGHGFGEGARSLLGAFGDEGAAAGGADGGAGILPDVERG
jgi:hypothetical protein